MISISVAKESQISEILNLEKETKTKTISKNVLMDELNNDSYIILVALTESNVVCGHCRAQVIADELHIYSMAVDKEYRRKKIGQQLLAHLLLTAKSAGALSATLEVRPNNMPAIALYESLGFFSIGTRKRYYVNDGQDALIMRLDRLEINP